MNNNTSPNTITFPYGSMEVRVIIVNDEPWFVAKQIAEILEYSDTEAMTRKLEEDEVQNLQIVGFGTRGANVINESGLYSAILTSKKPAAKPFKKWVTSEVLPSIRKTGQYVHPNAATPPPNPFNDILPELLPFQRVNSALLSELRRMSKSLAQAYLLECEVTPEYVNQQLSRLGQVPAIANSADNEHIMPLVLICHSVAEVADYTDRDHFYLWRKTFTQLCGDYDVTDTARYLRNQGLLKHSHQSLLCQAPRPMSPRRLRVFAIRKSILSAIEVAA